MHQFRNALSSNNIGFVVTSPIFRTLLLREHAINLPISLPTTFTFDIRNDKLQNPKYNRIIFTEYFIDFTKSEYEENKKYV